MNSINSIFIFLLIFILGGCAFQPRNLDVNLVEYRIHIPTESYEVSYQMEFLPTLDKRSDPNNFGVIRNKLMMVTAPVGMTGDLANTIDQMIRKNFQAAGIGQGDSNYKVQAKILESNTDLPGPDHIFVRLKVQLSMVDKDTNKAVFNEIITGYSVVGVIQLGNSAHESAFVNAMNQINEKIAILAKSTAIELRKAGTYVGSDNGSRGEASSGNSSGTGFYISRNGFIVTNNHVVNDCKNIFVITSHGEEKARVVASDSANDIAALKIDKKITNIASFKKNNKSVLGENVLVAGFPLRGLLGEGLNVSSGEISSTSGLGNDARFIQISAPIQSGNSGGPVIDSKGNVVGIVVSKLNVLALAKYTGEFAQNINFAIKAPMVKTFLDIHGISYTQADKPNTISNATRAELGKSFTVPIECKRE